MNFGINHIEFPRVSVLFSGGTDSQRSPGFQQFHPGDTVTGVVNILPTSELLSNAMILGLKWRTEGRGDVDEAIASQMSVFPGRLMPGISQTFPFSFVVPTDQPWSYVGQLISIVWGIEVQIVAASHKIPPHFAPLVVVPIWFDEPR